MRQSLIVLIATLLIVSAFAPATVAGTEAGTVDAGLTQDATCEYPVELTDVTGEEITLEESPDRVVALQPSDAQTVFEIGAEDTLVGMPITEFTSHLEAGDRTDVSAEEGVSVETVIDLEPDVVLAANVTDADTVQQLRDAGVTVYHFDTATSLDDVRENVALTGSLTGECEAAEERLDWMDLRLEAIEEALAEEDRPLAFWAMGFGWTAGENTFQDEILTTAGVENLAAEVGMEGWQEISEEVVVDEDPEWIIYGVDEDGEDPGLSEGAMETTAYEQDQLVAVDANAVNQPGPHVVYAIETIVEAIHPEAYEEAQALVEDAEAEAEADEGEETDADDGTEADDPAPDENETGDDGAEVDDSADEEEAGDDESNDGEDEDDALPGFGVPVAIAAVLSVLGIGIGRRRRR
ncbi:PGF-CTERM-anchored ABC transporter substrate-binding protein [Halobacteria archaeon AArc-m2/3/4]|uniref:PGF-CTERM-anchored ABC transporter substrate-binding protein n=1 Tax=Natronoglomus mannanivorans TaxID=2979990 RepID=A0AAP2YX10_9EURY|nr:PGF-CTERM-anchored ABC transporter substrate-binding protein [Halobacteria archaeon AArc-xg1-1]MCU4971391.1 PGF-CTERM-anchored ABC transporter substrate-binding protein [Halobacteria archaeon AArc-m2/3/4]